MDGMALLCNLHAGGAVTLRRLRRAGIHTLRQLREVPAERLAGIVDGPPPNARRFVREASLLLERMQTDPLELEEAAQVPTVAPIVPERPRRTRPASPLPILERAPIARAVPAPTPPARPVQALPPLVSPVISRVVPPAAKVASTPGGHALRAGLLAGLETALCRKLIEQDVRSLEQLVQSADLGLARKVGLPYTRLLDLAWHAQRFLEQRPEAQTAAGSEGSGGTPVILPARRAQGPATAPPTSAGDQTASPRDQTGAAGPFA